MFVDRVTIFVKSGNGGNGAVSFRREKYVAKGGPDGGDGGKGGDIVFVTDRGSNTLLDFKKKRKFKADDGADGAGSKFAGKSGNDMVITVPCGTIIKDAESGRIIKDMSECDRYVFLRGGKGGWGNMHFATATRQVPRFAKSGIITEGKNITLELKMLADVGLVGFPNVGKSTFLADVSSARPKVAGYHFTTLSPNLGVVSYYDTDFVIADIPGLIEGASEGRGLGHDFLRHIDRCRLIFHIFDISASERPDPLDDIKKINRELKQYSPELASRPQILVGNKIDISYDVNTFKRIKAYAARRKEKVFLISGMTGEGIDELIKYTAELLPSLPPLKVYAPEEVPEEINNNDKKTTVTVAGNVYTVEGDWLRKLCGSVNFDDRESLLYFQRILKNDGVIDMLIAKGIKEGDTVVMYGIEFDYIV